ncbi:sodium:solute symporter family transporter [Actomonas aquatica]|uniref:Sortase B protein-sorting domain-containing protein n=1 Tax=Actomonas aquatica TaxID=2866162 RepID=A0ABZ1C5L8_9BACT|nr:sortase B protein-sorting domain-containing protein [Opitutus sp. WL0086]WRQ86950.1 sortase B protein-sorting domain-containing protein [Opitutus sp. WL0086]
MHPLDMAIIGLYLVLLIAAGAWLARRAGQDTDSYFLGGRRLPWWALGSSGMSSNLDVAGTMTIVALITLYGLQGFWIEMRGGVVLPIAVFLAFMGKWHRRSEVMTTAEWMTLRFGEGRGGRLARMTAALTYVVLTVAMIVFFLAAGGRFLAEFLPYSETQCAIGIALIAFLYTTASGLHGVIWTDVVQTVLIGGAAIYVAVVASGMVTPELLDHWPASDLNVIWPMAGDERLSPYLPFLAFLAVWMSKGVLEGLGGSGGSAYMAQRFYAAGSERDCGKLAMLWTVLFAARWPMVLGFAIIAMNLGMEVNSVEAAEGVLPVVLQSGHFPVGVRGLILAAMLAAAMSTFDSTLNAGASYVVRDLYQPKRPEASDRHLMVVSYLASALLVAVALVLALWLGGSVLGVWVGIVMLLFPAFLVPFALRWYWGRFNGEGFAGGIAGGFAAALYFSLADPAGWNEATRFLAITVVSLLTAVVGTRIGPTVDEGTLRKFYEQIRPWGWWPRAWRQAYRQEHRADGARLGRALVWQICTFLLPMTLVLHLWIQAAVLGVLWIVLGVRLWRENETAAD